MDDDGGRRRPKRHRPPTQSDRSAKGVRDPHVNNYFGDLRCGFRGRSDSVIELGDAEVESVVRQQLPVVLATVQGARMLDCRSPDFWFESAGHTADFEALSRASQSEVALATEVSEAPMPTCFATCANIACTFGYEDGAIGVRLLALPTSEVADIGVPLCEIEYCTEFFGSVTHTVALLSRGYKELIHRCQDVTFKYAPTALFVWSFASHCGDLNAAEVVVEEAAATSKENQTRQAVRVQLMQELSTLKAEAQLVADKHVAREAEFRKRNARVQEEAGLSQRERAEQTGLLRDVMDKERDKHTDRMCRSNAKFQALQAKIAVVAAPKKLVPTVSTIAAYLRLEGRRTPGAIPHHRLRRYLVAVEMPPEATIQMIDECLQWKHADRTEVGNDDSGHDSLLFVKDPRLC